RSPPAMATTPLSPLTATGVVLLMVVPSPNWPAVLFPQALTVPSASNTRLWVLPAAMATTPLSPLTVSGVALFMVVPSPNWPELFIPHVRTVPSLISARLWLPPAEIADNPSSPVTVTGVVLFVKVPLPNCPASLRPQALAPDWAKAACEYRSPTMTMRTRAVAESGLIASCSIRDFEPDEIAERKVGRIETSLFLLSNLE